MTTSKNEPWTGRAAFYIDARAVQQRLDDTCIWKVAFKEDPRTTNAILCGISILMNIHPNQETGAPVYEWVTRWDGAENSDTQGIKGGLSGAERRAANQFGIGRYLYEVPTKKQDMKPPFGRATKPSYFVKDPVMPARFLPAGSAQRAQRTSQATDAPDPTSKSKAAAKSKKLTVKQTGEFKTASEGRDRDKVKAIYSQFITGKITGSEAITQVKALPTLK